MTRSGFAAPDGDKDDDVALAHDSQGRVLPGGWRVYPELAAAGMWSTAEDLARLGAAFTAALAGRAAPESPTPLMPAPWAQAMASPQARDRDLAMGLGLFMTRRTELALFHEGSNAGYKSVLVMLPGRRQGVAIMTNGENGRALIAELLRAVAHVHAWPGFGPAPGASPPDASLVAAAVGRYRTADGGVLELLQEKRLWGVGLSLRLAPGLAPLPLAWAAGNAREDGAEQTWALSDPLEPALVRVRGESLTLERRLFHDVHAVRMDESGASGASDEAGESGEAGEAGESSG